MSAEVVPLQRAASGCPLSAASVAGEARRDAEPLLQPHSSSPDGDLTDVAVFLDLEEGGGEQAPEGSEETPSTIGLLDEQTIRRALQRPSIALLVTVLLLCLAVCVGCWAMNVVGWVMLISSLSCKHHAELRNWLLVYLVGVLVEMGFLALVRVCHYRVVQDLDLHVGPGFVRACNVCYTLFASSLKIFWCIHAQVLIAAAKPHSGCGASMPHFVTVFSVAVLLRLLAVDTFLGVLAGLVLRFVEASAMRNAAGTGDAQAGGPAKPGTLDAMKQIQYSDELFDGGDETGTGLSKECCFCLEEFDQEKAIVMTPCKHTMHQSCLEKWLAKSHLCPICRGDLEES